MKNIGERDHKPWKTGHVRIIYIQKINLLTIFFGKVTFTQKSMECTNAASLRSSEVTIFCRYGVMVILVVLGLRGLQNIETK